MTSGTLFFLAAAAILIAIRMFSYLAKRRGGRRFLEPANEVFAWSPFQLMVASFLLLFAELAFIRWIAVEVRIFAYFKNLALLLCFLGFGLGCAMVRKPTAWSRAVTALFGLLLVIRLPWQGESPLERLSQNLGASADMSIWDTHRVAGLLAFALAAAISALLFLMVVWVF